MVSFGQKPWPIGDFIIETIQSQLGEGGLVNVQALYPGDRVTLASGSFKGLEGTVQRTTQDQDYVGSPFVSQLSETPHDRKSVSQKARRQQSITREGLTMSTLGKHCKGYPLKLLRQFPHWTENRKNARRVREEIDGEIVEVERDLTDSTYLYLQEDFTVTDSIFVNENIIFNNVTVEWIDYCLNVLGVQFPTSESRRSVISTEPANTNNA